MLLCKKLFLVIRPFDPLHNRIFDHRLPRSTAHDPSRTQLLVLSSWNPKFICPTIVSSPHSWIYQAVRRLWLGSPHLQFIFISFLVLLVPSTALINLTNLVAHVYHSNQSYFTYT